MRPAGSQVAAPGSLRGSPRCRRNWPGRRLELACHGVRPEQFSCLGLRSVSNRQRGGPARPSSLLLTLRSALSPSYPESRAWGRTLPYAWLLWAPRHACEGCIVSILPPSGSGSEALLGGWEGGLFTEHTCQPQAPRGGAVSWPMGRGASEGPGTDLRFLSSFPLRPLPTLQDRDPSTQDQQLGALCHAGSLPCHRGLTVTPGPGCSRPSTRVLTPGPRPLTQQVPQLTFAAEKPPGHQHVAGPGGAGAAQAEPMAPQVPHGSRWLSTLPQPTRAEMGVAQASFVFLS